MFDDITVEADSGQTFHFKPAGANWAGRSQVGRECTDLFWLSDGTWVLRRYSDPAQATGRRARVIGAEEARAWLEARPCAPLRAACLRAHQTLDLLVSLRHGLSAPAEQEVRGLWRVMREMVDAGLALVPPREPTFLADLFAGRAAVDEAIHWCQELEAGRFAECRHGTEFRSVLWFGSAYQFTATQAACVELLWGAWESGTPDLSQAYLLEESGAESKRLSDIFSKHPAWGTMIVEGGSKGTYRLAPPS
jgi:hypothetical protein